MQFPGFIGQTYQHTSVNADCQDVINLIPERIESDAGRNKAAFVGRPGLHTFCTLPTMPVRGLWAGENRLFAAGGSRLYEVFSGGTFTDKGAIADDGTNVEMFPNGAQLFVVSGGQGYLHDGVTLTNPISAIHGAFIDNYFIGQRPTSASPYGGRQFNISKLNDGTIWNALDYDVKSSYPDNIASILADHQELWLFGTNKNTEVWRNEGNADFPFQRDPSAIMHVACVSPWTPVNLAMSVYWLGGDARGKVVAYRAQGWTPVRISTHAVEQAWNSYSTIADAIGYTVVDQGHQLWVITFPTADATWVYDVTTQLWHKWSWWDGAAHHRHRARCHAAVSFTGTGPIKHYVGDHTNGNIYEMSWSFYDDFGGDIRYVRTCPHMFNERKRGFYSRLELDLETGTSTSVTPTASLDWSNNYGKTFNTPRTASIGAPGDASIRVFWNRLGSARDRVYRFTFTGQYRVALINAFLESSQGTA